MAEPATGTERRLPAAGAGQPEIAYRDTGPHAADAVVMLHSLGTDSRLWGPVASDLAGDYRLVIPDSRGHGRSGWDDPLTIAAWVADLDRVLDHAEVPRACLVGISMGGVQAIAYTAHHPDRVSGLVIADSFAELDPDTVTAKIRALTAQAEQLGMNGLADAYVADTFTTDPPVPGGAVVRDAIASMTTRAYLASTRTCFQVQLADRLTDITAPTLVLWGERDAKTPRILSERIADGIRGARLEVVPGAGHLSNIENPGAFTAAVRRFLGGVSADAASRGDGTLLGRS